MLLDDCQGLWRDAHVIAFESRGVFIGKLSAFCCSLRHKIRYTAVTLTGLLLRAADSRQQTAVSSKNEYAGSLEIQDRNQLMHRPNIDWSIPIIQGACKERIIKSVDTKSSPWRCVRHLPGFVEYPKWRCWGKSCYTMRASNLQLHTVMTELTLIIVQSGLVFFGGPSHWTQEHKACELARVVNALFSETNASLGGNKCV